MRNCGYPVMTPSAARVALRCTDEGLLGEMPTILTEHPGLRPGGA